MAGLQDRLVAADGLQPDILAKTRQSDHFRVSLIQLSTGTQDAFCAVITYPLVIYTDEFKTCEMRLL